MPYFFKRLMCGLLITLSVFFSLVNVSLSQNREIDSLIKLYETGSNGNNIELNIQLGIAFSSTDEPKSSNFLNKALNLANSHGDKLNAGIALTYLGSNFINTGSPLEAKKYIDQAINLLSSVNFSPTLIIAKAKRAGLYADIGLPDKAYKEYNELSKKYNEDFINKTISERNKVNSQTMKDTLDKTLKAILVLYNEFGLYLNKFEDKEKAIYHIKKVIWIAKEMNNEKAESGGYINLGMMYHDLKIDDEANKYLIKGLVIAKKIGHKMNEASAYGNLAELYFSAGKYETALSNYYKALELFSAMGNSLSESNGYLRIGVTFFKMNKIKEAEKNVYKALLIAKENYFLELQSEIFAYLSQIVQKQGKIALAFDYYKESVKLKDSLFNEDRINEIRKLELALKNETQEKQINILKIENELKEREITGKNIIITFAVITIVLFILLLILFIRNIKQKNVYSKKIIETNAGLEEKNDLLQKALVKLEELNATKDKFFSIMAHDIKNPISTLKNIANIVSVEDAELEDYERMEMLKSIGDTSQEVLNLLDNLLTWSRTQTGSLLCYPENIRLEQLFLNTQRLLNTQASKKRIQLNFPEYCELKAYADPNMIYAVIRNLVSNAIKYTFEDSIVTINAEIYQNDYVLVSVTDHGVGMDKSTVNNLFKLDARNSLPGTANETGTGLGLIICKEFVEKNGGKIWVESNRGIGSTFYFTLLRKSPNLY